MRSVVNKLLSLCALGLLVTGTASFCTNACADVSYYAGSDWCAQVNAADADFAGVPIILLVPASMSGVPACSTTITITSNHKLQFGPGSFDLGIQQGRAGIVIPTATANVDIGGAGRTVTSLYYTSANIVGNAYPMGSGIAIGTNVGCTSIANAANYIRVHDLHLIDRNTGSALNGQTYNPSGISGMCDNNVTIENNQLTDIKGNAAITLTGGWNTFIANNYQDRNNIFDGTALGSGGEFTADNSANWNNFSMTENTISYYPCGIGVSHGFHGIVADNILDMTLKAAYGNCAGIALGSGDATVGDLQAVNNIVILGLNSAQTGIGLYPKSGVTGSQSLSAIGNIIRAVSGSGHTGIALTGTLAGMNPPTMIVKHNTVTATYPSSVAGVLNNVEFADNTFEGSSVNIPLFNCTGATSIQSGGVVRVFGNRISTAGSRVASSCTDASFSSRAFQEWDNTTSNGSPNPSAYLGNAAQIYWTPGTIPSNSSTPNQVATVNQTIPGDSVKITSAAGGANWIGLPPGVFAYGSVTATNTVTFNITNTTAAPVTIAGGLQIQSYIQVDRPPN